MGMSIVTRTNNFETDIIENIGTSPKYHDLNLSVREEKFVPIA